MKNEQIEKLTDEIRKLREDVRELRQASQWPRIQYIPVPQYIPHYPQPSYLPWWSTQTISVTPCVNVPTVWTSGNVLANATTTTYQISTPTT